jgi:protein phosphatase
MKPAHHSHLPYAMLSDAGLVRDHNEDAITVTAFAAESALIPASLLCILCDGVGGNQGGEVASQLAIEKISQTIEIFDGTAPLEQLTLAIQSASESVYQAASEAVELRGMATTTAVVWIIGSRLFCATVGDSRIYLLRGNQAFQISTDHTWLQEAFEAGTISIDEFKNHPNAHVIKRFLGSKNPPEVDTRLRLTQNSNQNMQGASLVPGDIVFMCSDGISDLINPMEIANLFSGSPIQSALNGLKQLAYLRGAMDNLSMIAVQIPLIQKFLSTKTRARRLLLFGFLILLACVVGIYLGWLAMQNPG